jgi:mannan endo-1,6-alpha-mannosidase
LCALEVIQSDLVGKVQGPLTNTTGGTSVGDDSAGSAGSSDPLRMRKVTQAVRASAIIVTVIVLAAWLGE